MKPLRVLLIEDSERDAARFSLELRRAGYAPEISRVETLPRLREELERGGFDLVVSDYCLPTFNAPEALALFRKQDLDVPFIVISGAVGEDIAVEVMKSGAHDYVLKDRMMRLVPAIERELGEVKERRERRKTETLFRSILRSSPHPSAIVVRDSGRIVHITDSFRRRLMADQTLVPGQRLLDVVEFAHPERIAQVLLRGGTAPYAVYSVEGQNRVANVRVHTVEHQGTTFAYVVP
ncbi:MAG TPA: response regulator [Thermoanaerobaculia bacterium]|nr:response regulator [Thermoanaerobaculia bacterium]